MEATVITIAKPQSNSVGDVPPPPDVRFVSPDTITLWRHSFREWIGATEIRGMVQFEYQNQKDPNDPQNGTVLVADFGAIESQGGGE